jgi:replicative DNA helicase
MSNLRELNLPVDEHLEREILGACFSEDRTHLANVRAVLDPSEFSIDDNRRVFQSLCRLADAGEPLNFSRVFADMTARCQPITLSFLIELEGCAAFLSRMLPRAKDLARRRALIVRSREVMHAAADVTVPIAETAQRATAAIREAAGDSDAEEDQGDVTAIVNAAGGLSQFMAPRFGIPSPWPELDYVTGGWQKGDLILVAARPSMGKTAYCLNAAYHAATCGRHVAVYSLEMSREALVKRLVSMLSQISYTDLQRGDLNAAERRLVAEKLAHLQDLPLRIFPGAGKTVLALRCHAERLKAKGRLDFIVLDYIGLVRGFGDRNMNRTQEMGEIARQFKEMAGELQIPSMVLAQLSRASEKRSDLRPIMSDLRDSGNLEEHADLIAFLHRPGYYKRDDLSLRRTAELIVAKQRNGDTPTISLEFLREYGRFESTGGAAAEPVDARQMEIGA